MVENLGWAIIGVVAALAIIVGLSVSAFAKTAIKTAEAIARQPEAAEQIKSSSTSYTMFIESCAVIGMLVAGGALLLIYALKK